jgi:hypothetical protein
MNSPSAATTSRRIDLNQLQVLLIFSLEKLLKSSMMELIMDSLVMFRRLVNISLINAQHKIIHHIKIR